MSPDSFVFNGKTWTVFSELVFNVMAPAGTPLDPWLMQPKGNPKVIYPVSCVGFPLGVNYLVCPVCSGVIQGINALG